MKRLNDLQAEAIELLKKLITIPSFSKEEDKTGDTIAAFLESRGVIVEVNLNNIWAFNKHFNADKPTILLNSHHDTVKPNNGYTRDPFEPKIEDGKLYGLGSNDAGGALVSLIATFLYFYEDENLTYNLVFAATAEEEISGKNGIELIIPELGNIDFAIVGEPTLMNMAIAEKGLIVLDCTVTGQAGHAAREEGENAIYKALDDITWFKNYQFPKVSETLGAVKMSVTIVKAGFQHNVVPDTCTFVIDVRTTDVYTNEEVLEIIRSNVKCEVIPRSTRLQPSSIAKGHPIVKAGLALGLQTYGSPTMSDQALLRVPSVKIGPGNSARSHTADEFIYIREIEGAVEVYVKVINKVQSTTNICSN